MNPTEPAFPVAPMTPKQQGGMDLRTYMATQFLAADIAAGNVQATEPGIDEGADYAVLCADALIARLNEK